jgi:hypothetical protein
MVVVRSGVRLVLLFALAVPSLVSAQDTPASPPQEQNSQQPPAEASPQNQPAQPQPGTPRSHPYRRHEPPCWRQAGIAPEMVNQRWKIEDDAKTQINAVCSDPTLGPQQKTEKIHEINNDRDEQITRLIPANQLTAFNACQAKREQEMAERMGKTAAPPKTKELGPCGGVMPASTGAPAHQH